MNYEEKILTCLVEMYRKSKKDSGDNKINRRTQVKPKKFYKKYDTNDGDFYEISRLNQVASALVEKGFICCDKETFGTQIQCIYLVDGKILEIEEYLSEKYGYVSKDKQIEEVLQLIDKYCDASPICEQECSALQSLVQSRKVPKNYKELDDVFKAIAFIENNTKDLLIREVSVKVYGTSKYFETEMMQPVCSILHKYSNIVRQDRELSDEILNRYHIYKEPQKLCIKGNVIFNISDKTVPVSAFSDGIEIMTTELANIQSIKILGDTFMTIENRTSYLRYKEEDTVCFYLGGFANRNQRDFIKMVYRDNPQVTYLHFGDIDAGGFLIHHNLCKITGVDFHMFSMSAQELKNKKYAACLQQLTENDIVRLQGLCGMLLYQDVVSYMLENHVKLEQEIISLCQMKGLE